MFCHLVEVSAALAERESPPEGTKWTMPDWFREEWPSIAAEAVDRGGVALDFHQREGETVVVPKGWCGSDTRPHFACQSQNEHLYQKIYTG